MSGTSSLSRRGLLGLGAGIAAAGTLSGCNRAATTSGGGATPIKFWNMPWGNDKFNPRDQQLVESYKPTGDNGPATYQTIQWAGFTQTFASAIASNTGPAVSSGGGTQAFQFEAQGKIAYADKLLESWKSNGLYDDFLPGLIDAMKVDKGYVAVPYNLDMRVLWYNEDLLKQAGATVPTDFQTYINACEALKKIGVYGYGTGAGSGSFTAGHVLVGLMINNGGGLFNANKEPDMVTPENIQAMDFVLELVKKGYVDPGSVTYTSENVRSQYTAKKFGMGFDGGTLATGVGGEVGPKLKVASPLTGPTGKKGFLYFPNNIMMYTNTPSQASSEAFLTWYYQNMKPLWSEQTGIGFPPLKSIVADPNFRANANSVKIIEEWQPIAKTWGSPGGQGLFLGVVTVDATPSMDQFTQSILSGQSTSKDALTKLQTATIEAIKAQK